jgi:predicted tellurium resistance membrane protein TerC
MLAGLIEIVWLDLIFSGDNAVLLAVTTRALPMEQRRLGVNVGTLLFIALRIALAYAIFVTAGAPGAGLAGALLLVLAVPALVRRGLGAETPSPPPRRTLAAALFACLAADAPNALWNMLAVQGAASGAKPLVMFGLALSIPLLALGSIQFITILRKPPLLWASVALIGWTAGSMAAADLLSAALPAAAKNLAPVGGAALALVLAFIVWRGRRTEGAV